jgi:hypothetical protein
MYLRENQIEPARRIGRLGVAIEFIFLVGLANCIPACIAAKITDTKSAAIDIHDLRVDGMDAPLGLDSSKPVLSWRLTDGQSSGQSIAYQVQVAASPADFLSAHSSVWDSGRVASAALSLPYAGPALGSHRQYFWRVRVWDADGSPSAWSEASQAFLATQWSFLAGKEDRIRLGDAPGPLRVQLVGITPDGNGFITRDDFIDAAPSKYKAADKDHNGVLSKEEFLDSLPPHK